MGDGRIELELDGKPVALVPTLEACTEISKMAGGLAGAVERCRQLHFETICAVVGAGLEINGIRPNPTQRSKFLPKAVYEAGVVGVAAYCMEFITVVSNGGRPLRSQDEDGDDDGEDGEGPDGPLGSRT